MLMTRLVYLSFTLLILAINGAALWTALTSTQSASAIVPGALIINAVIWPLALVVAYRVGRVTGVEYLRKIKTKGSTARA